MASSVQNQARPANMNIDPREYMSNLEHQFKGTLDVLRNLYISNGELQQKCRDMEEQLSVVHQNIYSLVLVDGDGMIFNSELIAEGRAGGRTAARKLHKEAKKHLSEITPHIRVYANIEGLARALKHANIIGSVNTLREFVVGFSDPCVEHCDFIDVGDGKEMADEKIKSELKWHLKNANCYRILLGASHDNGYARVLSTLNHSRIELLEGPPFGRELEALEIPQVRFPELFATSKIESFTSTTPSTPPGLSAPSQSPKFSYAAAAAATTPPPSPQATMVQPVTAGGAPPSRDAMLRIKTLFPKPCNNFYLKGNCMFDKCYFGHDYKLKPDDLAAMRKLAATKKCVWGQECTNEKCYYSHEPETMALGGLM
ncbi:hypothetical protein EDC01DRAFT_523986 [Geopyxis carbonaria]|nr:hypothetical protein EDC01DRAFT_523986 [Geopyxis carbonaria]